MTATLTALREAMTDYLTGQGLRALSAWPGTERLVRAAPLAVVRMKGVEARPLGFQNYLGQVYDRSAGAWRERYGQKVTVTFCLDLYSPRAAGEEGCRLRLDQAAGAFQAGGPGGLAVEQWSMEEPVFDRESGMFRGELTAVCRGTLEAVSQEDGSFLGFEVKGVLQEV